MDFGAVPDAKFRGLHIEIFFETLSSLDLKFDSNCAQSHVPEHADARQSCWGPLRVVSKLRTTDRHGFRCDLARVRAQNFAALKIFRKFRPEIRFELRAISRARACRRSAELLGTSEGPERAALHKPAWILTRFRTQNFAAVKIYSKISTRTSIRTVRNTV